MVLGNMHISFTLGDNMKYLYFLLGLFLPISVVSAQGVLVEKISRDTVCVGDTVWVTYTSGGPFKTDNFFAAQLSDANGSFATFSNIGHANGADDSIPVIMHNAGSHFILRVIATDPYTISSNTSDEINV